MEAFGFKEGSRGLVNNGEKDVKESVGDDEEMEEKEGTEFRGIAARMNFFGPGLSRPPVSCKGVQ